MVSVQIDCENTICLVFYRGAHSHRHIAMAIVNSRWRVLVHSLANLASVKTKLLASLASVNISSCAPPASMITFAKRHNKLVEDNLTRYRMHTH